MAEIRVIVDEALDADIAKGGEPLRSLCRREAQRFDAYLRNYGQEYSDGLASWEQKAVEGYLYQKLRGHIDEKEEPDHLPGEG